MGTAQAQWKPTKPITIIAVGGRRRHRPGDAARGGEIEPALGQKIVVVNQPGGAGSIGTSVLEGPKDGYTWTAGGQAARHLSAPAC